MAESVGMGNQQPGGRRLLFGRDGEWAATLVREKKGF
jgi:hypothetical protein